MVHFNWLELIPGVEKIGLPLATSLLAGVALIFFSLVGRSVLGTGEKSITPAEGLSFKGIFEALTEFIINLTHMVIGPQGIKFVPLFGSMFLFVFFNNILGIFPGMTPATDNVNIGVAVGVFSFLAYNFYGFKEHGLGYLHQFMGPLWWLAPLMIVVELLSHMMRPLTLGLRLKTNMEGDHIVLGVFLDLIPYGVPALFYGLGLFVCFMQAFVFTLLSMIYVSMAISHDH